MDFVKNQIQRIQQQLVGLTASQKMLTASLVVIMVMTLLYWGRMAGTAEMVPLLEQSFTQQDIGQIQARLEVKGIPFANSGDRLLVPAERRMEALADLAFARALPQDSASGFDQMISKLNPFSPQSDRAAMQNRGKEITCAQLIGRFPDVDHAEVMIDPTHTRHVGNSIEPSASITITMGNPAGARQVAEAAAAFVAGAQAGLAPAKITVIVNGVPQRLRAAGEFGGMAADQFELQQKHQLIAEERIRGFYDIPGLRVTVGVRVNHEKTKRREETLDAAGAVAKEVEVRTSEDETTNGLPAGEPGVEPNVRANQPMSVAGGGGGGGGGGGQTSRQTEEDAKFAILVPTKTETLTESGPGAPTYLSASVRVPRSFFVGALKARRGSEAMPAENDVEAYALAHMKNMEQEVRNTTGMDATANVTITKFDDAVGLSLVTATLPQTATVSVPVLLGSYGKEAALGALALVSLFMLMMMVKRSAPVPAVVAAAVAMPNGPSLLMAGEMLAGEAGDGETTLRGMELDDDAVTTQQMLDQVSTMVKDNPDGAAALVKRWLNRD